MLDYSVPPTFYHSAIVPPDDYSSTECAAGFQVYPFRPFTGDIRRAFQTTLLRDWIDPRFVEEGVAVPPQFQTAQIAGADAAFVALFSDNPVGIPRPHMRIVIVSGHEAAIVDASANNPQSWQMVQPSLNVVLSSLQVRDRPARRKLTEEEKRLYASVAGLYMGVKPKFIVDINHGAGSGGHVMANHFYLFSGDGRVHRAYDGIEAPGGEIAQFDYDQALAQDPGNTGTYTVESGQLRIVMGGEHGEPVDSITAPVPQRGVMRIETVRYAKQ